MAQAQQLEALSEAKQAYVEQRHEQAVLQFRQLLTQTTDTPIVLECRKYLAASLLFLGKKQPAQAEYLAILEMDPEYTLDPLAFPNDVLFFFEKIKYEWNEDRQAARDEQAQQEQLREQELVRLRAENIVLREMAENPTFEHKNSRLIASIPFGVGQFQNEDPITGWAVVIISSVLAAGSITTAILHNSLNNQIEGADPEKFDRVEQTLRYSNWGFTAAFVTFALGGILDAHLHFVPSRKITTRRTIPSQTLLDTP